MAQSCQDVLYGAAAIGQHIGLRPRQIYSMADQGRLPVFRTGAVLCSTPALLDDWRAAREAEARRSLVRR